MDRFSPENFELYTTYKNSRYSKPDQAYYKAIINYVCVEPEDCLMIGKHVDEDMFAKELDNNYDRKF